MTDTTPDGAPLLQPETPPHFIIPEDMELEVSGTYAEGTYAISIKSDRGVEFALACSQEGLAYLEFMLAAFGPAVEQVLERLIEQMEADAGIDGEGEDRA